MSIPISLICVLDFYKSISDLERAPSAVSSPYGEFDIHNRYAESELLVAIKSRQTFLLARIGIAGYLCQSLSPINTP
jgi:hypothetical protein